MKQVSFWTVNFKVPQLLLSTTLILECDEYHSKSKLKTQTSPILMVIGGQKTADKEFPHMVT